MATATYNQTLSSAAARAQGTAVTHYMIRTALTGGSDRRVFFEAFSPNGAALAVGQRYDIPANTLIVTLPTGSDTTADGAEWCLEQIFENDLYLSLHTGAPGAGGADEGAWTGYARILLDSDHWTFAE